MSSVRLRGFSKLKWIISFDDTKVRKVFSFKPVPLNLPAIVSFQNTNSLLAKIDLIQGECGLHNTSRETNTDLSFQCFYSSNF